MPNRAGRAQNLHAFSLRADEAVAHTLCAHAVVWPGARWRGATLRVRALHEPPVLGQRHRLVRAGHSRPQPPRVPLTLAVDHRLARIRSTGTSARAPRSEQSARGAPPFGFNMRWSGSADTLDPELPGARCAGAAVPGASGYVVWLRRRGPLVHDPLEHGRRARVLRLPQQRGLDGRRPLARPPDAAGSTVRPTTRCPRSPYGPWSPVYTSYNPPFSPGPMQAMATVSNAGLADATSWRRTTSPRLRVQRQHLDLGHDVGAYRVAVFTDEDCLNPVFRGAMRRQPGLRSA